MIPAWYQRMNPRERLLSLIVAGIVVVLLNPAQSRVIGWQSRWQFRPAPSALCRSGAGVEKQEIGVPRQYLRRNSR